MTDRLSEQQLADIETRVTARRTALSGWINCYSPLSEQEALENAEAVLTEDVPALLAALRRAHAELADARAAVLAEVAAELEGINVHPNAKAPCIDLCRLLAGRFRRAAAAQGESAPSASLVAPVAPEPAPDA